MGDIPKEVRANQVTDFPFEPTTMSLKATSPRARDRTPQAALSEARIHDLVGYQLAQATIVTNQVFDELVRQPSDLRPVEFTILALVQNNPDVTARQLARALAVTPPNIAIWIDKLQSRGLVERTRGINDARMQHIRLTTRGATLVARSVARLLEGEDAVLSVLSAAERAMLVELLHKVALSRRAR
jgi:DNA-binding MarR family transcriptional regulator